MPGVQIALSFAPDEIRAEGGVVDEIFGRRERLAKGWAFAPQDDDVFSASMFFGKERGVVQAEDMRELAEFRSVDDGEEDGVGITGGRAPVEALVKDGAAPKRTVRASFEIGSASMEGAVESKLGRERNSRRLIRDEPREVLAGALIFSRRMEREAEADDERARGIAAPIERPLIGADGGVYLAAREINIAERFMEI